MDENTKTILEYKPEEGELQDMLIEKWGIAYDYRAKSILRDNWLHSGITDGLKGEVNPSWIIRSFVTDELAEKLLDSDFRMRYENGGMGDHYNARKHKAVIKSTHDLLHEIGHGLWYELIPRSEENKKQAVIESLVDGDTRRIVLPENEIPDVHKEYARLMGAYSGQFLENPEKTKVGNRMNDLEESFARNIDYLLRLRPLEALPDSANGKDFIDFFGDNRIINSNKFAVGYLRHKLDTAKDIVKKIPARKMKDGEIITKRDIARVWKYLS
jgi:hypothetical protein